MVQEGNEIDVSCSKNWNNLRALLALHFCRYNFARVHSALRITPSRPLELLITSGQSRSYWRRYPSKDSLQQKSRSDHHGSTVKSSVVLKLDRELICDITMHLETDGVTYAVIRPDGTSPIFGRRVYLFNDVAKLVRAAVKEALNREKKQRPRRRRLV